mgnify:CR=1 FL=1
MSQAGLSGLNPACRFHLVVAIITMGSGFYMKVAAGTTGRIVIIIHGTLFMCLVRYMSSRSIMGIEVVITGAAIIVIMIGTPIIVTMIGAAIIAMEMDGVTIEAITINS